MDSTAVIKEQSSPPKLFNRSTILRVTVQCILFCSATLLASWSNVHLLTLAIGIIGVCCVLRSLKIETGDMTARLIDLFAFLATGATAFGVLWPSATYSIDLYYVGICAVVCVATAITWVGHSPLRSAQTLRWLTLFWAGLATVIGVCYGYFYNFSEPFLISLVAGIVLLITMKKMVALPGWSVQVVNTILLLCILLPIVDWFTRPKYHFDVETAVRNRAYSCDAAKADPVAFKEWWYYYMSQWGKMGGEVYMKDPTGVLPYKLKPNSDGHLFQSAIHINSLGFRGKEIAREKGNAYRIVALGESTTYGCTLRPQDQTWPELLEEFIHNRIKTDRPVQVINAGVFGFALPQNLRRLQTDILPLKPDLIISYHGWNGFVLIRDGSSGVIGKAPPRFYERPLRLLADCEYSLKVMQYRRHNAPRPALRPPSVESASKSKLGDAYRSLIDIARTNNIRLAIANYSMAVNERADPDVAKFYDMTFPVFPAVSANVTQTKMIEALISQNPQVAYIDTQPHLDGEHEKFIDLVHFTQDGRNQIAENIYAGIEKILRADLTGLETKTASQ